MNITTAAHYMKLGYRVRRECWEPEDYLFELAGMLERVEVSTYAETDENGVHRDIREVGNSSPAFLLLDDLLADDWKIITAGIRKEFNKHGAFEYQDETDWDNWKYNGDYFD